jgi:hypothetical protein
MRVRKVDENGDMVFGGDQAAFLRNSPDAVAQIVESRLNLWQGEWYLDLSDGTPYEQNVLGRYTANVRDAVLQRRILTTPGVDAIKTYSGFFDTTSPRDYSVSVELKTAYSRGGSASGAPTPAVLNTKVEFGR